MIIVRLIGGLGNQMFQYALGRKLAKIHNVDLKLDVSHFGAYQLRSFCLHQFDVINELATPDDIRRIRASFLEQSNLGASRPYYRRSYIKEQTNQFDPNILLAPSDAYLEGYWQSQKYFQDIADIIRHDFRVVGLLSEQDCRTAEKIKISNSIALHVRRGDYVTNKHTNSFHGVCSLGYYSEALEIISEHVEKPTVFIFSDDMDWVKANLKTSFPCNYVAHNSADKDYADLWLMSLCKHQIIANSTFSWWAAWLNNNCDKLVIAPKKWFATDTRNDKDLIPDTWLRISDPGVSSIIDQERGREMIDSGAGTKLFQETTVAALTEIDLPGGAKALFSPKKTPDKKTVLLTTSAPPEQTPFPATEKWPPIGIGYLIAVLREAGHGIVFIDQYLQSINYVSSGILQSLDINFVGIYCNTICFRNTLDQVYQLEEQRIRGMWNGKIMVGGPHVSVRPETLPTFVDFLVQGEGEQAIVDIVEGKVHDRLVKYPHLLDLDVLPRPAWDFFVRLPYNWEGNWLPEAPVFTMNTSRGCPFSCTFCSVCSIWGKHYTYFSAERIVADIEHVVKNFGARGIYFREDNFTLKRDRLIRFCNLLMERNIRIPWVCESRVSNLDRELVALMARAGAVGFYFGVESGSQRLLDFMKKGIAVQQIRNVFRWCHELDIKTAASVIVGAPTETEDDLRMTASLLEEIKPTVTWFNIFVGIPDSELFRYARKHGYVEFIDDRGLAYMKGHNRRVEVFYGSAWDAKIPVTFENGKIAAPLVSVVMSVHNGERHLKQAIQSILCQSFLNYEFIIIDDASTDATPDILLQFKDPRLSIIRNTGNLGLTASLNIGIRAARGKYVARMDADDLSVPHRLARQVEYLENNPEIAVVGSSYYTMDEHGVVTGIIDVLDRPELIQRELLRQNWFGHGSVLMRKSCLEEVGGYDERFIYAQDYDLFLRFSERYKLANLTEPLYIWRESPHGISASKKAQQDYFAEMARSAASQRRGAPVCSAAEPPVTPLAPLVSVIVPTHNRPDMLATAISSILAQTMQSFEIIVVNDAGTDVRPVLDRFGDRENIRHLVHETNRGLAAARNTGINAARGKYIAYLDDDDTYYPNHLETLVAYLESNDCRVAYTDANCAIQQKTANGFVTVKKEVIYSRDFDYDAILYVNFIPVLCVIHEKACLSLCGMFDEYLSRHEDWDLWIRMSRHERFAHIKTVTCEYTYRPDGSSMTSSSEPLFFETYKAVCRKYDDFVKGKPLVQARRTAKMFNGAFNTFQFIGERLRSYLANSSVTAEMLADLAPSGASFSQIKSALIWKRAVALNDGTAIPLLEIALVVDRENHPARVALCERYMRAGQYIDALRHIEYLAEVNPQEVFFTSTRDTLLQAIRGASPQGIR